MSDENASERAVALGQDDVGPIDSRSWPSELEAKATMAGPEHRLFGYDVERDLAAHYRFSDVIFLSLVGELPSDAQSRAFEIALCYAAPMSAADASVHASMLARLCGARPSGVLSVAGMVLGEQASALLTSLGPAGTPSAEPVPASIHPADDAERSSVTALSLLLEGILDVPLLRQDPSRDRAVVAVFNACGITAPFTLACLLGLARIPSALAEATRVEPGNFAGYPIDTPHFEYVPPSGDRSDR